MQAQPYEGRPRPSGSSMRGLIVLNTVLLLLLAAVTFAPAATAQARKRGAYTMVAGGANNSIASVVFIVDTVNQEMVVMQYDSTTRTLVGVTYRDLAADAADLTRTRTRAGG